MHACRRRLLSILALCLAASLFPAQAEHHEAAGQAALPPEMQEMLALAEPGPQHRFLRHLEGEWTTESRFWTDPSQPPMVTLGRSVTRPILGGRFVQTDYTGEFLGMPFQGLGIDGYDRVQQKYVGVWMDTMGTMILTMEGELDESGKVLTMTGEHLDPMTGKPSKAKAVTTILSDEQHRFEYYTPGPDGEFFRTMEMLYTRR